MRWCGWWTGHCWHGPKDPMGDRGSGCWRPCAPMAVNTSRRPAPAMTCATDMHVGLPPSPSGCPKPGTDRTRPPSRPACARCCPMWRQRSTGESIDATGSPRLRCASQRPSSPASTRRFSTAWAAADAADEVDQLAVVVGNAHQGLRNKTDYDEVTRRALADVRTGSWRDSMGAVSLPPHIRLLNSTLTPAEAQEVIDSLSELDDRPVYQRFLAYVFVALLLADACSAPSTRSSRSSIASPTSLADPMPSAEPIMPVASSHRSTVTGLAASILSRRSN